MRCPLQVSSCSFEYFFFLPWPKHNYLPDFRYMDKNKEVTRMKREEIWRLKEHVTLLQQRLERYSDLSRFPPDIPSTQICSGAPLPFL